MNALQLERTPLPGRVRIGLPIDKVLDRIPGDTVTAKAKKIGITRQAYYGWLNGRTRPDAKQSRRLAQLTGLSAVNIRGWIVLSAAPSGDDA